MYPPPTPALVAPRSDTRHDPRAPHDSHGPRSGGERVEPPPHDFPGFDQWPRRPRPHMREEARVQRESASETALSPARGQARFFLAWRRCGGFGHGVEARCVRPPKPNTRRIPAFRSKSLELGGRMRIKSAVHTFEGHCCFLELVEVVADGIESRRWAKSPDARVCVVFSKWAVDCRLVFGFGGFSVLVCFGWMWLWLTGACWPAGIVLTMVHVG